MPLAPTPGQQILLDRLGPDGKQCQLLGVSGGIQSGKSLFVAMDTIGDLPWLSNSDVFIMGPDHRQSRSELEYIIRFAQQLGLYDENQVSLPGGDQAWRVKLKNGTRFETYSAVNFRKMAGKTPRLVILTEPGQMQDAEPFYLALARAGLTGCKLTLAGTLEGSTGWFADLLASWEQGKVPGAIAHRLPTWSNTVRYPLGRLDPKILAIENNPNLPRDRFRERYAGERVAPPGLVFGRTAYHPGFDSLLHVRTIQLGGEQDPDNPYVIHLPEDQTLEVWVDWGWDHHYAVLFGCVRGDPPTMYACSEIALQGIRDPEMIQLAASHRYWPRVGRAILDPSTKQHRSGPLTTREYWAAPPPLGAGLPTWADETVPIETSTDKIRALLQIHPQTGLPRLIIDPSCKRLIWEFSEGYRNLVALDGQSTGKPIDRFNDAIKCLHYASWVHYPGLAEVKKKRRERTLRRALPFR